MQHLVCKWHWDLGHDYRSLIEAGWNERNFVDYSRVQGNVYPWLYSTEGQFPVQTQPGQLQGYYQRSLTVCILLYPNWSIVCNSNENKESPKSREFEDLSYQRA